MMIANSCEVLFDGILVGYLAYTDDSGFATFEYDNKWVEGGFSISPLYLPLGTQTFTFQSLSFNTFRGLPAVFADSLPDDFGNALIDAWLAATGKDKSQFLALDRLLYTGTRGMGGLEYQPTNNPLKDESQPIQISELVEMAQKVLDQRGELHLSGYEESSMAKLLQIGTSAGGARAKAVIAVNEDRTEILSGQVKAPEGFEHYLLKFDGVEEHKVGQETFGDPKGFGLMEYVYYLMATKAGINMSECELLRESGSKRAHFMTKRFDRNLGLKYHILSLCGIAHADFRKPGEYSYEELLAVTRQLNLPIKDQEQIFRRMVFNIVARNHDDHTKNWAFMVNDQLEWVLAPAYDLAWSYKKDSPWVNSHQLSLAGKRDNFYMDDLLSVSELISNLRRSKAQKIINETIEVVSQWRELAEHEGVPESLRDNVWDSLRLDW